VKANAAHEKVQTIVDMIPFGQPILVSHHSQKRAEADQRRIERGMDAAVDNSRKASDFRSRADNIESAAAHAIYSDDEDAVDRLEARIAGLEAERDRVKAYNASCRKGAPDVTLLTERERSGLVTAEKFQGAYQERRKHQMPPYVLANLSGIISTQRKRLERLKGMQS
jgi:hypothetical protein